jgi:hypothetical protein
MVKLLELKKTAAASTALTHRRGPAAEPRRHKRRGPNHNHSSAAGEAL